MTLFLVVADLFELILVALVAFDLLKCSFNAL